MEIITATVQQVHRDLGSGLWELVVGQGFSVLGHEPWAAGFTFLEIATLASEPWDFIRSGQAAHRPPLAMR